MITVSLKMGPSDWPDMDSIPLAEDLEEVGWAEHQDVHTKISSESRRYNPEE